MSVSRPTDRQAYRVMTYLSLRLIPNKTVELVYENAPEALFEIWQIKNYPLLTPLSLGTFGASILAPSALDPLPHCSFDKS